MLRPHYNTYTHEYSEKYKSIKSKKKTTTSIEQVRRTNWKYAAFIICLLIYFVCLF